MNLASRYLDELRVYLDPQSKGGRTRARAIGVAALAAGLETLDLARMHEAALTVLIPPETTPRQMIRTRRQSRNFFQAALQPFDLRHRSLKQEIIKRQEAEEALLESERQKAALLIQSRRMEQELRQLSRQILVAQEDERKKISREVHDQIAQMLAGINVHLCALKNASSLNGVEIDRRLRNTQRMVEKSVDVVHRFARELRPPALDDLGLIPALQTYFKSFSQRTGIPIRLTIFSGIEALDSERCTVLYRVAQAALTNISQHAKASRIVVKVLQHDEAVDMRVQDDGKGFDAEGILDARVSKRLGLLGMRERVEMVGGKFSVTSSPGSGTTIGVLLPFVPAPKSLKE